MSANPLDAVRDLPLGHETREERLADGFRPLDVVHLTHDRLDGSGTVGPMRREVLRCRPAAVILAYDAARDSLVLIRQFRIGHALAGPNAAAVELPAGLLDAGESVETAAARELEEETGLVAEAVMPCFSFLSSPGLCDELIHVVLALVDAGALGQSAGLADEHEDIRPFAVPADALVAAVDRGDVLNGPLILAAHWFARHGRAAAARLTQDGSA